MNQSKSRQRWVFVLLLLFFLSFHQLDVFLLRPITTQMIAVLNAGERWIDPLVTLSLVLSILFSLLWGYLFDRHSRGKILVLISFLWGVTSWLMGISPTLATYLVSSASGGIDNLSFSGVFSLAGDYFGSKNRGKIFGLFLISQPLGLFLDVFIATALPTRLSWRLLLLLMGAVAFLFTILINFLLHEPQRGAQDRGMTDISIKGSYLFDWEVAKENLKAPSLLLAFVFSIFGTAPWFILTTWISPFFQEINQISSEAVAQRLLPALIVLMMGYPIGGFLGDLYARKRDVGRLKIVILGALLPPLFLFMALKVRDLNSPYSQVFLILMAFFMSCSWPNLIAVIFEITLPEVRSFTTAIALALQALGGLLGQSLVPVLRTSLGLEGAILSLTIGAWLLGFFAVAGLFRTLPKDIENMRRHMAYRSHLERRLSRSEPRPEG